MTFDKHGQTGANIYVLMLAVAMIFPVTRAFSDLGFLPGSSLVASLAIGVWINARAIIKSGASGKGEILGLLSGLLAWLVCWGAPGLWVLATGDPADADVVSIVSVVAVSLFGDLACRRITLILEPRGRRDVIFRGKENGSAEGQITWPQVDFNRPWTTDMLEDNATDFISRFSLDRDKGYLGDPHKSAVEIGLCPFCRTPMVLANGCPHVVFCFDRKDGDYRYIREDFKEIVASRLINHQVQPTPEELENRIDGLKLSAATLSIACLGFIWGYVDGP